jgi:hypothetical protein
MEISKIVLSKFLVEAKKNTYAIGNKNVVPEREGFDELIYIEGDFTYRDSYYGFFRAPGQEIVRVSGEPVWVMSYNGGMLEKFVGNIELALKTFGFLKKALALVEEKNPFRGPTFFEEEKFVYKNFFEGDVLDFKGHEEILFNEELVFEQDYFGGLIIDKEKHTVKG